MDLGDFRELPRQTKFRERGRRCGSKGGETLKRGFENSICHANYKGTREECHHDRLQGRKVKCSFSGSFGSEAKERRCEQGDKAAEGGIL